MNFDLSEEQALFKASAERFVEGMDVETRRKLRGRDGGYDRARWNKLAELGLIALAVGEDSGGMGGSLADLAIVGESLGTGNSPDPWLENGVLPAMLLARGGAHDTLEGVIDGSTFAALAFAERAARYELEPRGCQAKREGDSYTLSGEKTFVHGGAMADLLIVTARCDGETGLFVVPANAEGVDRRAYVVADGSLAAEVVFRSVSLPGDARLDGDLAALQAVVARIRLLAGAEMVGLAQRLLDDTLAYAKQREQFGVPIGSFQALQHRLVDCYAKLEQARSMLWRVALAEQGEGWGRQAAGAKSYIAEQALHIGREAVQMHGGMGVTDELAIGHALKRVMLLATLFGDAEATLADYAEAA